MLDVSVSEAAARVVVPIFVCCNPALHIIMLYSMELNMYVIEVF